MDSLWSYCCSFRSGSQRAETQDSESEAVIATGLSSQNDPFVNGEHRHRPQSASAVERSRKQRCAQEYRAASLDDQLEVGTIFKQPSIASIPSKPPTAASSNNSLPYGTPPESRWSEKHLLKHRSNQQLAARKKAESDSPRSCCSHDHHDKVQPVLAKMEELERERQNQHNETREMMLELNQTLVSKMEGLIDKLDELVTYFLDKRDDKDDKDAATGSTGNTTLPQEDGASGVVVEANLPRDCTVSSKVILGLAKVVPKWKFLARELGVAEHEIQQITENHSGDVEEQSYQMLLKWKKSKSDNSCHTLGEAVRKEFGGELFSRFVIMVNEAGTSACSQ